MQILYQKRIMNPKPFLKWAGGKKQLLNELEKRLPVHIRRDKYIGSYVEPFIGGGAMYFFLKKNFHIKESTIFDINKELIIGYKAIKYNPYELIEKLCEIEDEYSGKSVEERKKFFYKIRDVYNEQMEHFDYENYNMEWIERAKYLIFLNKTCFNGLFRQNSKGEFNVPFGRYKNPKICDRENIIEVHKALKDTRVFCNDFTESGKYIREGSFVYFDPPYRPLNKTSNFTSYSKDGFNDEDQKRLADFFEEQDKKGAYLLLSNSDPKNEDYDDDFFDNLYKNYYIERISAKRYINRDVSKRGEVNEIIVRNYKVIR